MNFEFVQDHGPRPEPKLDNLTKVYLCNPSVATGDFGLVSWEGVFEGVENKSNF